MDPVGQGSEDAEGEGEAAHLVGDGDFWLYETRRIFLSFQEDRVSLQKVKSWSLHSWARP